jgi:hypothetical protein
MAKEYAGVPAIAPDLLTEIAPEHRKCTQMMAFYRLLGVWGSPFWQPVAAFCFIVWRGNSLPEREIRCLLESIPCWLEWFRCPLEWPFLSPVDGFSRLSHRHSGEANNESSTTHPHNR